MYPAFPKFLTYIISTLSCQDFIPSILATVFSQLGNLDQTLETWLRRQN